MCVGAQENVLETLFPQGKIVGTDDNNIIMKNLDYILTENNEISYSTNEMLTVAPGLFKITTVLLFLTSSKVFF